MKIRGEEERREKEKSYMERGKELQIKLCCV